MRRAALLLMVCVGLLAASCGDDGAVTTTSAAPTTTTAPPATTAVTTTTTTLAPTTTAVAGFTPDDLFDAVLHDGDPWPVPIQGVEPFEITIDDIWPADMFPEERAAYETAGFAAASFAAFAEDEALILTGAHLFATPEGADAAFAIIEASFSDLELVAQITGLDPGSLNMLLPLGTPDLGDQSAGVLLSGPQAQVVGIIWTTGNLLQFVRAGMALGDEERTVAVLEVARAMAARLT